jgi:hypothetical protein
LLDYFVKEKWKLKNEETKISGTNLNSNSDFVKNEFTKIQLFLTRILKFNEEIAKQQLDGQSVEKIIHKIIEG